MEYKLKDKKIVLEDENQEKGKITWEDSMIEKDVMYVTHTIVDSSMQGKGIAQQLLDQMVEYARGKNKKIVPVCSYVQKKFNQDEQYEDVYCKTVSPDTYIGD